MENEEKDIFASPQENGGEGAGKLPYPAEVSPAGGDNYGRFAERTESTDAFPYPSGDDMEFEKDFSALEKKKKNPFPVIGRNKAVAIAGIVLLVLLIAAGASYFFGKDKPAENIPSGDSLIFDPIMQAMRDLGSYSYDGTMTFGRTLTVDEKQYGMEYQIIYKGVVEKGEEDPSLYSSLVYDTVRSVNAAQSVTSIGLQSVAIDGKKYLKMDNLLIAGKDDKSKAAFIENNLKGLNGNWYAVSDENYDELYTTVEDYAFLPEDLDLLSVEEVNIFNKAFNYGILASPQDLGSELIGETDTTHYKVGFNAKGVLEFVTSFSEGGTDGEGKGDLMASLRDIQKDQAQSEKLQKVTDYLMQKISAEIWVGKSDNLIYRFRIGGTFDDAAIKGFYDKLAEIYGESYDSGGSRKETEGVKFDIDYTLSGFNTAKVRDVEGAKDFTEVKERLKIINPDAMVVVDKAAVDTDGDGLSDEEEKTYGSDPKKADTDGDGYGDGSEVKGGYDPVVAGSARLDYDKLNKGD